VIIGLNSSKKVDNNAFFYKKKSGMSYT
jgi:hypothetical protein